MFWDIFKIIATLVSTIIGGLAVFFIKQVVFSFKTLVMKVDSISTDITEMKVFMKDHSKKMDANSAHIEEHEKRIIKIEAEI